MKTLRQTTLLALALLLGTTLSLWAGDDGDKNRIGVGLGVGVSIPQGVRIEAGVRFNPYLSTRVGVAFIPSIKLINGEVEWIDLSGYKEYLGYTPAAMATARVKSFSGHLLVDYHPFKSGFRLTAGAFIGRPGTPVHLSIVNPATGQSVMVDPNQTFLDPNNMPKVTIETKDKSDHLVLQPSPHGTVDAQLHLGRLFQPYVGLGYGYAVPKGRVTFMFDAGVLFNGKAVITSPNAIEGNPNILFNMEERLAKARYYTQVLPVLNLGIAVRLF